MSASLVGSEMCIRDRRRCGIGYVAAASVKDQWTRSHAAAIPRGVKYCGAGGEQVQGRCDVEWRW
eukprot:13691845-Alexandrium_andersonii.AAC.1